LSRDPVQAAPALEYLGHILPRAVFRPVARMFEQRTVPAQESPAQHEALAQAIRVAWQSGDSWLQACAVRASRLVPDLDPRLFTDGPAAENSVVKQELAAISALHESPRRRPAATAPPTGGPRTQEC